MAFLAVKRVSDLDVIDQPRASQTTGGKRHEIPTMEVYAEPKSKATYITIYYKG